LTRLSTTLELILISIMIRFNNYGAILINIY
jgi:hypothetical protein